MGAVRVRAVQIVIATLMLAFASVAASEDATVEAVWKPQLVAFSYTGTTTHYSCPELASKLKRVLRTLGAHEDVIVDRSSCTEYMPTRLRVRFRSPVPATTANIDSITSYDATEQLAARLNKEALPSADELPRFSATWREISFAHVPSLRLDPSDCQFVEDVRRQMLPRLSATETSNRLFCTPGFPGISKPRLRVKVLLANSNVDQ